MCTINNIYFQTDGKMFKFKKMSHCSPTSGFVKNTIPLTPYELDVLKPIYTNTGSGDMVIHMFKVSIRIAFAVSPNIASKSYVNQSALCKDWPLETIVPFFIVHT